MKPLSLPPCFGVVSNFCNIIKTFKEEQRINTKILGRFLLLLLSPAILCSTANGARLYDGDTGGKFILNHNIKQKKVESILSSLTLRQKISQMFIAHPPASSKKNEPYEEGGMIFLGNTLKNKEVAKRLIANLKQRSIIPPFFVADIEGGRINRLRKQLKNFPSAKTMGTLSDAEVYRLGYKAGKAMREIGLNMNLAPVLDVSGKGHIYKSRRSFSGDAKVVIAKGKAFSKGLLKAGVAPIGKHFPGYGDGQKDTDKELSTADWPTEKIDKMIDVFRKTSPWLGGIMLSNKIYSKIDDVPAPFSSAIIERARFNNGIIMTDDLAIGTFRKLFKGNRKRLIRKAFLAGSDIFLFTTPTKWKRVDYIDEIHRLVKRHPFLVKRVDASVKRILMLKFQIGLL